MSIRWLLKEGPMGEFQGIAALEIDGVRYEREEVETIVAAYHADELQKRRPPLHICVCGHWQHLHTKVCSTCGCANYRQARS